jgi:uncharacterized protein (DUF305 family)
MRLLWGRYRSPQLSNRGTGPSLPSRSRPVLMRLRARHASRITSRITSRILRTLASRPAAHHYLATTLVLSGIALGCAKDSTSRSQTAATDSTATATATAAVPAGQTAAVASQNADDDFLRKMSDHHKGLILIVHQTVDRKDVPSVMPIAAKLDTAQDAELDSMMVMLRQKYNDTYDPHVMPEHQAMADSLKALSGTAYERTFLEDAIRHHKEAVAMINQYLPKLSDAKLKAMATRMRRDQQHQIADYERRLASHK